MRWLVTGGCGFIGRNFIRLLLTRSNDTIRVVDDLSVGTRAELEAIGPVVALDPETLKPAEVGGAACRIEIVAGDVRDAALARRVVAGADAVIHLAANTGVGPSVADPMQRLHHQRARHSSIISKPAGLAACAVSCLPPAARRSASVSRRSTRSFPPIRCRPTAPASSPARPIVRPIVAVLASIRWRCASAIATGRFRPTRAASSPNSSARPWLDNLGRSTATALQTRDFIYVEDIAEAIFRGATAPDVGGEIFQVATNAETTVLELAEALRTVLERNGVRTHGIRHAAPRVGDVKRNYSDTTQGPPPPRLGRPRRPRRRARPHGEVVSAARVKQ